MPWDVERPRKRSTAEQWNERYPRQTFQVFKTWKVFDSMLRRLTNPLLRYSPLPVIIR